MTLRNFECCDLVVQLCDWQLNQFKVKAAVSSIQETSVNSGVIELGKFVQSFVSTHPSHIGSRPKESQHLGSRRIIDFFEAMAAPLDLMTEKDRKLIKAAVTWIDV